METVIDLQLLNEKVFLPDLTIGQAMDIAKIPEHYNEKRISGLISHLTGDNTLADRLTVQERYYFLLNHQSVSDNKYSLSGDNSDYFIPTVESEVLSEYLDPQTKIGVQHLRGKHACLLETLCENVFDWLAGSMACQLYGELSAIVGGDVTWEALGVDATDSKVNEIIQDRFKFINDLPEYAFNKLVSHYTLLSDRLTHYLITGIDNTGITILSAKGGAGEHEAARFLALAHLQDTARQLAKFIA